MSLLNVIISMVGGSLLGLSLAAPPGPMNAVIAEESVLRGWLAGFKAGLGAMSADAVFCALAFAGVVAFIRDAPTLKGVMVGVGGLLMFYFSYGAYKGASEDLSAETGENENGNGKGFQKAFVLAITNPYQITWWITAGVALIESYQFSLAGESFVIGGITALVGFFAGIGIWITGFPATLTLGKEKIDAFAPAVAYGSAILLAFFGVTFLYDSVTTLFV